MTQTMTEKPKRKRGGAKSAPTPDPVADIEETVDPEVVQPPRLGVVAHMPTVTLLADQAIDTERLMLEGIDTSKKPLYSISEMAQFFFARSPHWMRWLETENRMVLDGEVLKPIRTKSNARKYDLALVEKIAHALASNGTIKATQLRQALLLVKIQAEMNEYL